MSIFISSIPSTLDVVNSYFFTETTLAINDVTIVLPVDLSRLWAGLIVPTRPGTDDSHGYPRRTVLYGDSITSFYGKLNSMKSQWGTINLDGTDTSLYDKVRSILGYLFAADGVLINSLNSQKVNNWINGTNDNDPSLFNSVFTEAQVENLVSQMVQYGAYDDTGQLDISIGVIICVQVQLRTSSSNSMTLHIQLKNTTTTDDYSVDVSDFATYDLSIIQPRFNLSLADIVPHFTQSDIIQSALFPVADIRAQYEGDDFEAFYSDMAAVYSPVQMIETYTLDEVAQRTSTPLSESITVQEAVSAGKSSTDIINNGSWELSDIFRMSDYDTIRSEVLSSHKYTIADMHRWTGASIDEYVANSYTASEAIASGVFSTEDILTTYNNTTEVQNEIFSSSNYTLAEVHQINPDVAIPDAVEYGYTTDAIVKSTVWTLSDLVEEFSWDIVRPLIQSTTTYPLSDVLVHHAKEISIVHQ